MNADFGCYGEYFSVLTHLTFLATRAIDLLECYPLFQLDVTEGLSSDLTCHQINFDGSCRWREASFGSNWISQAVVSLLMYQIDPSV